MMGGGFGGFGLGMLLFWILIIGAVVVVVRAVAGGSWGERFGGTGGGERRARQVLDERFARGEIDREEYEEKRRLLQ
jgi:putative membrane protein